MLTEGEPHPSFTRGTGGRESEGALLIFSTLVAQHSPDWPVIKFPTDPAPAAPPPSPLTLHDVELPGDQRLFLPLPASAQSPQGAPTSTAI